MRYGNLFEDGAVLTVKESETAGSVIREICREGRYRAEVEDLGFMWRWNIYRDGEMCQEGCSLSEQSSHEAVRHVLAFFHTREESEAAAAAAEADV
jgi:soluble methane monooxygenase-binding protein MmoD